jgi:hypothetical protein
MFAYAAHAGYLPTLAPGQGKEIVERPRLAFPDDANDLHGRHGQCSRSACR